ncbi:MAG: galactose-1-epimerase, partial [Calditrichaeota bacterium]|nr:galactose-1-epimerase [Calditrichota bacterium]
MKTRFGTMPDGRTVDLYTLTNAAGMEMSVTNYGGIIVSLKLPGSDGRLADVVLGYDRLDDYLRDPFYLGALIGRYANRIAGGRFVLNGKTYALAANNGPNHLHGGVRGFNRVL